jgi:uncharacterized membrane protein
MRALKWIHVFATVAALGASPLAAVAVQDERAAREECSAYSGAGMRDCLARKPSESAEAQECRSEDPRFPVRLG